MCPLKLGAWRPLGRNNDKIDHMYRAIYTLFSIWSSRDIHLIHTLSLMWSCRVILPIYLLFSKHFPIFDFINALHNPILDCTRTEMPYTTLYLTKHNCHTIPFIRLQLGRTKVPYTTLYLTTIPFI